MLKQRLITAAVLIPLVMIAVIMLDALLLAGLFAVFICLAAWEWAAMCGYKAATSRVLYVALMMVCLSACYLFKDTHLSAIIIVAALIWWPCAMLLVISYKQDTILALDSRILKAGIGVLVLVPAWLSLMLLHAAEPDGVFYVIFLLTLIWSADTVAYFSGRRWGKHKLSSVVSPAKSWEGVIGALIVTGLLSLLVAVSTNMQGIEILIFLAICLITALASVLGDLFESMIKRYGNLKDSGSLLPGHGGVMDRLDSLTAASPVFLAGLWLLKALSS
ncbi:MAG: phosphatidate cytidylyltransferase [Gammaproteobacteria bacterium]|nr:phosphatidate cytidylyltransferase [Gammaproteobacteria bacterium]